MIRDSINIAAFRLPPEKSKYSNYICQEGRNLDCPLKLKKILEEIIPQADMQFASTVTTKNVN